LVAFQAANKVRWGLKGGHKEQELQQKELHAEKAAGIEEVPEGGKSEEDNRRADNDREADALQQAGKLRVEKKETRTQGPHSVFRPQ